MSTHKKTRSVGETPIVGDSIDAAQLKSLLTWCTLSGMNVTALEVGNIYIELAPPAKAATRISPPERKDSTKLYEEYGGEALAELLDDAGELEASQ